MLYCTILKLVNPMVINDFNVEKQGDFQKKKRENIYKINFLWVNII